MPIVQLVTVSSGQTLNVASALGSNTLIDVLNGGTLNVLSGGAAFSTVDNGVVHVSGGMVSGTTVETGGELDIFSAGTARDTLAGVAIVNVFSGATAIRTTLSGFFDDSIMEVFSGGTAGFTSVSTNGEFDIETGGSSFSTTITDNGVENVERGATASGTTVNGSGSQDHGSELRLTA